jgi:ABC-type branched-subunit amino acid transport system ATPase component
VFLHGASKGMGDQAEAAETSTARVRERERAAAGPAAPVLEVAGLSKRFGGIAAVTDVSFTLHQDEILGLIGPNGAGKTTIFDMISGHLVQDGGTVRLDGVDVSAWGADRRAAVGLGRSFQDARIFPSLTVAENIAIGLERHIDVRDHVSALFATPAMRESEEDVAFTVEDLIELLGLGAFRDKFVSELSTGSRRIVDLAMSIAHDPKVLILDEPSSGIAQRETEALGPLLLDIRRATGCAMLVIEHDMPLITSLSDQIVALELGRVVLQGTPDEVLADPRVVSPTSAATCPASSAREAGAVRRSRLRRSARVRGGAGSRHAPGRRRSCDRTRRRARGRHRRTDLHRPAAAHRRLRGHGRGRGARAHRLVEPRLGRRGVPAAAADPAGGPEDRLRSRRADGVLRRPLHRLRVERSDSRAGRARGQCGRYSGGRRLPDAGLRVARGGEPAVRQGASVRVRPRPGRRDAGGGRHDADLRARQQHADRGGRLEPGARTAAGRQRDAVRARRRAARAGGVPARAAGDPRRLLRHLDGPAARHRLVLRRGGHRRGVHAGCLRGASGLRGRGRRGTARRRGAEAALPATASAAAVPAPQTAPQAFQPVTPAGVVEDLGSGRRLLALLVLAGGSAAVGYAAGQQRPGPRLLGGRSRLAPAAAPALAEPPSAQERPRGIGRFAKARDAAPRRLR